MQNITFNLDAPYIELNQLLKLSGICHSGGSGKILVAQGLVKVDGKIELRKTCKIKTGQKVSINNTIIHVVS